MTTSEQNPAPVASPEPTWGTPPTSTRSWGARETAAAIGVAAVIAALGGAVIYAATDGGPGQPFGPAHAAPGGQIGPPAGAMFGPGPDTPSVHGEFVVADANGGYSQVLTQTGGVTALSGTSITVRSADGFVETYAMPAGSPGAPFAVGDQVIIRATRLGQTPTVTSIATPQPASGSRPH